MRRNVWGWVGMVVVSGSLLLASCVKPKDAAIAEAQAAPVTITGDLENKFLRADASGEIAARIDIDALVKRASRPPVNLALVIDTSGSMEGAPIEDARKSSLALLDSLRSEDRLAVVTFDSKAQVLLASTTIGDADLGDVRAKIAKMRATGTTDMAGGLNAAVAEVTAHMMAEGVNRVILVGDGVPNVEGPVMPIAQNAAARGISITSLGLGTDYNEVLMGQIAQTTGGRFHLVEDSTKLRPFFDEEIARLERVLAKNATLEIVAGPGVAVEGLVGYAADGDSAVKRVSLGDVSVGDKREVVVKVATPPRKDGAPVELFDAILRYQDGTTGEAREERFFFGAHATGDVGKLAAGKNKDVSDAVARAVTAAGVLDQIRNEHDEEERANTAHKDAHSAPKRGATKAELDAPPMPSPANGVALETPAAAAPASLPTDALARKRLHDQAIQNFQVR